MTTRTLTRCRVKDCPRPDDPDFHVNVCPHKGAEPTHVHWPKKGMGGNNPNSKIRVCMCWPCHDWCDNTADGGMNLVEAYDGTHFIAWKRWHADPDKREMICDVLIGETNERATPVVPNPATDGSNQGLEPDVPRLRERDATDGGDAQEPPNHAPFSLKESHVEWGELTFNDWLRAFREISFHDRNSPWHVGEAWVEAEDKWHDSLWQVADDLLINGWTTEFVDPETGEVHEIYNPPLRRSIETVSNYANVCRAFPESSRHRGLSFSHHSVVYKLPPNEREAWLVKAEAEHLTERELRALVRPKEPQAKRYSVAELRELADEFYRCLLEEQGMDDDRARSVLFFPSWLEERDA